MSWCFDDCLWVKKYCNIGANETPVEATGGGAFGGAHFKDIYSSVTETWYKMSWKQFNQLQDIHQNYYCSDYHDRSVNEYGVKCETSLRFWKNKGCSNKIDPYG